jgi:hypothetical protein
MEIWEPETPGTLWATPGLKRDSFNNVKWGLKGNGRIISHSKSGIVPEKTTKNLSAW